MNPNDNKPPKIPKDLATNAFVAGTDPWIQGLISNTARQYGVPSSLLSSVYKNTGGLSADQYRWMGANPNKPEQTIPAVGRYLTNALNQNRGNVGSALDVFTGGKGGFTMATSPVNPAQRTIDDARASELQYINANNPVAVKAPIAGIPGGGGENSPYGMGGGGKGGAGGAMKIVNAPGTTITQAYGVNNPGVEVFSGGVNRGADVSAPIGTPLALPPGNWYIQEAFNQANPNVGFIGDRVNNGYGNSVVAINQNTGEKIRMSHLSTVAVKPGQIVTGGLIGTSGKTGNTTGPHVDMEYFDTKGKLADIMKSPYAKYITGNQSFNTPDTTPQVAQQQPQQQRPIAINAGWGFPTMQTPTFQSNLQQAPTIASGMESQIQNQPFVKPQEAPTPLGGGGLNFSPDTYAKGSPTAWYGVGGGIDNQMQAGAPVGMPAEAPQAPQMPQMPAPQQSVDEIANQYPVVKIAKQDVVNTDPVINLKRDVPITDIHGKKDMLQSEEAYTPYQLKGNKYLLKDGEEFIVSKNQYQNIRGNAIKAEAKPFAPELGQLNEKTLSGKPYDVSSDSEPTKYEQYTLPGGQNYKEILMKAPVHKKTEIEKRSGLLQDMDANGRIPLTVNVPVTKDEPTFKSSHWDEPNVLAHVRLNERTLPNGKKVTFMEEAQSDWAREARKHKGDTFNGQPQVPEHPLLGKWQELAVKRGLKDAVDNGSDYFSWTTGEQQQARYNLSKQVDLIEWQPYELGKTVRIEVPNGPNIILNVDKKGMVTSGPNSMTNKPLTDVVGKGVGEKILTADKRGYLKGEGLNIGGEWAKKLYDEQIPNIVKDLTGKKTDVIDLHIPGNLPEISWNIGSSEERYGKPNHLDMEKYKDLKVGSTISDGLNDYTVTSILGGGKFKAIMSSSKFNMSGEDSSYRKIGKEDPEWIAEADKRFAETFSLDKKSKQQAIKITPEIRALVKGEAPKLKQPSGILPWGNKPDEGVGGGSPVQNMLQNAYQGYRQNVADKSGIKPNTVTQINQGISPLPQWVNRPPVGGGSPYSQWTMGIGGGSVNGGYNVTTPQPQWGAGMGGGQNKLKNEKY